MLLYSHHIAAPDAGVGHTLFRRYDVLLEYRTTITSTRSASFAKLQWAYEGQVMRAGAGAVAHELTQHDCQVLQDVPTQNVAGRYDAQGSPFLLETQEPLDLYGNKP